MAREHGVQPSTRLFQWGQQNGFPETRVVLTEVVALFQPNFPSIQQPSFMDCLYADSRRPCANVNVEDLTSLL